LNFAASFAAEGKLSEILSLGTQQQKISALQQIISGRNTVILPEVSKLLDDTSQDVRTLAAQALFQLGDSSFVTSYQKAMNDSYWQVRLYGVRGLVKWGTGEEVIGDFKRGLDDTYWQIRYWSAIGLGKFGDETVIDVLLSHLKDENPSNRAEILWALRRILGRDEARYEFKKLPDDMVKALKDLSSDPDIQVQINAVWMLEATNDKRVVPLLIAFLDSPMDEVKLQTVWALEHLKQSEGLENLRAKLAEPSVKLKIETIKTLVRLKDIDSVDGLLLRLGDKDENVRVYSLWALRKFNDEISYPAIVGKLTDTSERVRQTAYQTILALNNPEFIPILEDAVTSDEFQRDSKVLALELLGKIGNKETGLFFDSIKDHPDSAIRKTLLTSWYQINPDDSSFLTYLNFASRLDSSRAVRSNAQRIINKMLAGISEDISAKEGAARSRGVEKLSFLKDCSQIAPLLKKMLASPYEDNKRAALQILPFQPSATSEPLIKDILAMDDYEMKKLGVIAVGKTHLARGKKLVSPFLKNDDPVLAVSAAYSLALLGDSDGLPVAMRNLASQDMEVQSLAAETIGILKPSAAQPVLLRLLEGAELDVKLKIAWALARLGEEKGLYTLVNLSMQDIEPIRTQARKYLLDSAIPTSLRKRIPALQEQFFRSKMGVSEVSPKIITAFRLSSPPAIDGKDDDECWRMLQENRSFIYLRDEKVYAEVQTTVMAGYDSENLYLVFVCMDPEATNITFDSKDFLTLCINPMNEKMRWYQFTLHPTNFLKFAFVWKKYVDKDPDTEWTSNWVTATTVESGRWIAEIAIPLRELGGKAEQNNAWQVNFQRTSDHLPETTWTGKIDNPAQFGRMTFKGEE
jgi:HEAT repeat protein